MINKCILGNTGLFISKVGLGTVQFGLDYGFTKKKTQEDVDAILAFADSKGINFLDTARSYGDSEEKIGNFTSQNRNGFIIGTKLGKITTDLVLDRNTLKTAIYRSIETSLGKLKKNRLDILQLHQTDDFLVKSHFLWDIIQKAKSEKLIGAFGISVYEVEETRSLIDLYGNHIDFFQIPYNVFDKRFEGLKSLLEDKKIGVISRSTFLKGMVTCGIDALPPELSGLADYKKTLEKLAAAFSIKVSELAMIYVYYKDFITTTILGVDSVGELEENTNILDSFFGKNSLELLDKIFVEDPRLTDPRKWTSI